jgi:alkanesulfonate monooxygenase SsuD/methylene tetrahydromethanopterin reductase-like flavin-dependent oxidoreductase (luciferase family)
VWLLGSSPQSAIWAAQLGIPYAFADFINPGGSEIAAMYRERFASGERRVGAPMTAVAAWVLCAESDEEAQRLAASSRMTLTLLRRGQLIAVPPVDKALAFLESEGKPVSGQLPGRRGIIGSPATVSAGISQLAEEYGADEVIVVTITHDHAARRHSYALVADAMGLSGADRRETQPVGAPDQS